VGGMTEWTDCRACGRLTPGRWRGCYACGHDPLALVPVAVVLLVMLIPSCWAVCSDAHACPRVDPVEAGAVECGLSRRWVADLAHVEELAGIPQRLRGTLAAAVCVESRGNPWAVGDGGRALGPHQIHRRLRDWCGLDDDWSMDPVAAASCIAGRWVEVVRKARAMGCRRPWRAAYMWVAKGPRGYRCDAESRHHRVLRRWRR